MKIFYVTTPIYYANSAPHLGSLYTTIVADALARYKRQCGFDTFFLTGTDEHGVNIQRVAMQRGLPPQKHVDEIVEQFKDMFARFHLDPAHGGYDIFMRTTEAFHYEGVAQLWRQVKAAKTPKGRDCVYKGFYEGWFCAPCATFKTEDEYIKPESGDETPRCAIHLTPLDRVEEESYFFRLSDYDETLLALYEAEPELIAPEARRNEVISFIKSGLQDLSISRPVSSISWGIPVPDDPSHSIYVWIDALSNYITAIGYGNDERERAAGFEKYWSNVTHLVGKDILRQHTIYWHSFLLAAGLKLPNLVFAHGMWLDRSGRKMSKTLKNSIDPNSLAPYFSPDVVRYFCLREMIFGQDGKFSYEGIIDRANSDLASGLGNLASRTLTMIHRYADGVVPHEKLAEENYLNAKRAGVQPDAGEHASWLERARDEFIRFFESYQFSRALESAWTVVARTDKFISDAKPWELAKDAAQRETLGAVLYRAAETLRWLAVLLHPVMPAATRALWQQLGQSNDLERFDPAKLKWGELTEGARLASVEAIFPRLDKAKIMKEIENNTEETIQHSGQHATQAEGVPGAASVVETKPTPPMRHATEAEPAVANAPAPPTASNREATEGVVNYIDIEDFAKIEMRVGEILTAERVPKADKLLRFTVNVGETQPRQILAGIAQHYEPEALVGRKVVIVANLKPRKLRGFESQGMVLAASIGEEGRPVLATFAEDVEVGARLK
ncbi:MAG: methionine--tRNA ligase [Pyrinomonadaceae bacterium]|nr:methionine--tRNA ligase [Pyrinomonadaceae bacterium]